MGISTNDMHRCAHGPCSVHKRVSLFAGRIAQLMPKGCAYLLCSIQGAYVLPE